MLTRAHFAVLMATVFGVLIGVFMVLAHLEWRSINTPPAPRTVAQLPACSPLVWLIDNLLVVEMLPTGGWTANQAPFDSETLATELPEIYRVQPARHRLLIIQADSSRIEEDITWLLAPLDTLAVTVVARPARRAHGDQARIRRSPRVAQALDSWKADSISAVDAASIIADERVTTCALIEEDTVQAMHPYVQAELARRAGWN